MNIQLRHRCKISPAFFIFELDHITTIRMVIFDMVGQFKVPSKCFATASMCANVFSWRLMGLFSAEFSDSENEAEVIIEQATDSDVLSWTPTINESVEFDLDGWTLIPTERTGWLCGLFALIQSIRYQINWLRIPSVKEIQLIARSGRIGEFIGNLEAFGTREYWESNFLVDHLDAILQEYGRLEGVNLQLGVHHANKGWRLIFSGDDRPEVYQIWIHHDSANVVTEDGIAAAHYSGMKPPEDS
jgi:hypothetical protein